MSDGQYEDGGASHFKMPLKWANHGQVHEGTADYPRQSRYGRYAADVVDADYLAARIEIELSKPLVSNCGDSPARLGK